MRKKIDRIPPAIAYQQLVELGQRMDALMEQERQSAECAEISAWLDEPTTPPCLDGMDDRDASAVLSAWMASCWDSIPAVEF